MPRIKASLIISYLAFGLMTLTINPDSKKNAAVLDAGNTSLAAAQKPDSTIQSACPQMTSTICTEAQFLEKEAEFRANQNMQKITSDLMLISLSKIKDQRAIIAANLAADPKDQVQCIGSAQVELTKQKNNLDVTLDKLEEYYKEFLNLHNNLYNNYSCMVCDKRYSEITSTSPREVLHSFIGLQSFKDLIRLMEIQSSFEQSLNVLSLLMVPTFCKESSTSTQNLFNPEEFGQPSGDQKLIDTCKAVKTDQEFAETEMCADLDNALLGQSHILSLTRNNERVFELTKLAITDAEFNRIRNEHFANHDSPATIITGDETGVRMEWIAGGVVVVFVVFGLVFFMKR